MKTIPCVVVAVLAILATAQFGARVRTVPAARMHLQPGGAGGSAIPDPWAVLQGIVNDWNGGFKTWQSVCAVYRESATACSQTAVQFHVFNKAAMLRTVSRTIPPGSGSRARPLLDPACTADLPDVEDAIWFNKAAAPIAQAVVDAEAPAGTPPANQPPISFSPDADGVSEIIRAEFEVIPKTSGTVCLHLYDTNVASDFQHGDLPAHSVDLDNKDCSSWAGAEPIPVGCFFSPVLTDDNLAFYQGPNETPLTKDDTLLLLGFHVIQKYDSTNWLWSTFWWQAPQQGAAQGHNLNAHSCSSAACQAMGPNWAHYVMNFVDTTASTPRVPAVFNPYLDGGATNAPGINCLVCHSFAAANGKPTASEDPHLGAMAGETQAQFQSALDAYFKPTMRKTDMLWSLARRLTPQPTHSQVRGTTHR